jgi:hypothetical protein
MMHDLAIEPGMSAARPRPASTPGPVRLIFSVVAERVVARTLADPPTETPHWTDLMARASGISASAIRRIWNAHGLQPHRCRQFKLSKDPNFVAKLRDVVGLYVDPPARAIVLSVDEKSQIQPPLDRTQPGVAAKEGPARNHDTRLQAARHPRRCSLPSTSSTARPSAATCSVIVIRNSFDF